MAARLDPKVDIKESQRSRSDYWLNQVQNGDQIKNNQCISTHYQLGELRPGFNSSIYLLLLFMYKCVCVCVLIFFLLIQLILALSP